MGSSKVDKPDITNSFTKTIYEQKCQLDPYWICYVSPFGGERTVNRKKSKLQNPPSILRKKTLKHESYQKQRFTKKLKSSSIL